MTLRSGVLCIQRHFYPLFDEKRLVYTAYNNEYLSGLVDDGYDAELFQNLDCRQDGDLNYSLPLDIALDYGKFSCIETGQEEDSTFRYLSSMSAESPRMIQELCDEWCDYYRFHGDRTVYYW